MDTSVLILQNVVSCFISLCNIYPSSYFDFVPVHRLQPLFTDYSLYNIMGRPISREGMDINQAPDAH